MAIAQNKMYAAERPFNGSSQLHQDAQQLIKIGLIIGGLTLVALVFLMPLIYMVIAAFKSPQQITNGYILPMSPETFTYQGKQLDVYDVPIGNVTKHLALLTSTRSKTTFIDPENVDAAPIELPIRKASLKPSMELDVKTSNFQEALKAIDLPVVMRNTLAITVLGGLGAVLSAAFVGYGFSRFRVPGAGLLFIILMTTIVLPPQVTVLPLFVLFQKLGWIGTILPLIIPHFFGNAYNIFLLRQFFLSIPSEMDEAAKVDGATPLQTFFWVIFPQAKSALLIVALFHFVYAWGEFYQALIFTAGTKSAYPIAVVLQFFQVDYGRTNISIAMAGCLLAISVPVVIFLLAQRAFIQNVVITGVEK